MQWWLESIVIFYIHALVSIVYVCTVQYLFFWSGTSNLFQKHWAQHTNTAWTGARTLADTIQVKSNTLDTWGQRHDWKICVVLTLIFNTVSCEGQARCKYGSATPTYIYCSHVISLRNTCHLINNACHRLIKTSSWQRCSLWSQPYLYSIWAEIEEWDKSFIWSCFIFILYQKSCLILIGQKWLVLINILSSGCKIYMNALVLTHDCFHSNSSHQGLYGGCSAWSAERSLRCQCFAAVRCKAVTLCF